MGDRNTYPYPTPEEINKEDPKSFSDQELKDYNSAIDKLEKANNSSSGRAESLGLHKDAGLTDSEEAAFDKYTDDLMYDWKVPLSNSAPTWAQDGHDETYKPSGEYSTVKPEDPKEPGLPPPVAGGEEGDGNLVVNTDAIKTFKDNLKKLQDVIGTTQKDVEGMKKIKPGYFGMGGTMYRAICGDKGAPGLQENTATFLHGTVNTFDKLMTDIDAMTKEYVSVDELNSLTAEKLNKEFDDAFSAMGNLGQPSV